MTIVNANSDMTKSYNHMMTNYEKSEPLARKEKPAAFKRERLSDEDNDRVNCFSKILESEKRFAVNRVFCVGQNYAEHAIEMGFQPNRDQPFYFTKSPSSVVASGSTIPYPFSTDNFHHEMELVVAIGTGGYEILADTALSHIFGYACGLDMTRRDLQTSLRAKGHPWCISKDLENGAVISSIQPAKICGHSTKARIWLSINGQIKQDSNIDRLI